MKLSFSDTALIFKALSDETRLKIINMLSGTELCACNILEAFQITQPTLSYHMRILCECGLVKSRKEGAWTRYALDQELFAAVLEFINGMQFIPAQTDSVRLTELNAMSCASSKATGGLS